MDLSVRNDATIDFTHAISNCDFNNLFYDEGFAKLKLMLDGYRESWHAIKGLLNLPFLRFSRSCIQQ